MAPAWTHQSCSFEILPTVDSSVSVRHGRLAIQVNDSLTCSGAGMGSTLGRIQQLCQPVSQGGNVSLNEAFFSKISHETVNGFGFNIKDADGNPAGEVALSDVFNVIRDTAGVRKIGDRHGDLKLNGLPADVKLGIKEFPILGDSIALINGDTGAYF